MTKAEKRKLTRVLIDQYQPDCPHSLAEWVALKLGLSLTEASKLVQEAGQ